MQKASLFLFIILFSSTSQAEWVCAHPQVCQLIADYFEASNQPVPPMSKAISSIADPHHIEPTSKEIKKMFNAEYFAAASDQLHPWVKSIIKMRTSESKLKTIQFSLADKEKNKYSNSNSNKEALAHFWLYPDIICSYWTQFHAWLASSAQVPVCPYLQQLDDLKSAAKKVNMPVIVSHDAIIPLLQSIGIKAYAIKGSGHHEEPRPEQLKALKKLIDHNPTVIWIHEKQIHFPHAISDLQRTNDKKIMIDTNGDYPQTGQRPLQQLISKLNQL